MRKQDDDNAQVAIEGISYGYVLRIALCSDAQCGPQNLLQSQALGGIQASAALDQERHERLIKLPGHLGCLVAIRP